MDQKYLLIGVALLLVALVGIGSKGLPGTGSIASTATVQSISTTTYQYGGMAAQPATLVNLLGAGGFSYLLTNINTGQQGYSGSPLQIGISRASNFYTFTATDESGPSGTIPFFVLTSSCNGESLLNLGPIQIGGSCDQNI